MLCRCRLSGRLARPPEAASLVSEPHVFGRFKLQKADLDGLRDRSGLLPSWLARKLLNGEAAMVAVAEELKGEEAMVAAA